MACSCEGKGAPSKIASVRYAVIQQGQTVEDVKSNFRFLTLSAAENVRKKIPGATIEVVKTV